MALHGRKFKTKLLREHHLAEVSRLFLSGVLKGKIAEIRGVAPSQISYDLKMLVKQWREQALQATGEVKARELAKLDQIEAQAWSG